MAKPKLRVVQTKSTIHQPDYFEHVLRGLGLRGRHSEVVVANTPAFRGMIKKVIHLVSVEELDG